MPVHIALDARFFLQLLSRSARAANELSLSLRLAACARRNSLQQHFPAKSVAQKTLTKNPKTLTKKTQNPDPKQNQGFSSQTIVKQRYFQQTAKP